MINREEIYLMKRLLRLACAGMMLASSTLVAQEMYEWGTSVNSGVEFAATNDGLIGLDEEGRPIFTYPRGSNKSYLFGGGLWFGTRKVVSGQPKKQVFITYNPRSGASWGKPGERIPTVPPIGDAYPMSYNTAHFSRITGESFLRDFPYPKWPLWVTPGENINPMNAGTFERHDERRTVVGGTYVGLAFVPGVHEQLMSRFHDGDLGEYELVGSNELDGYPIGLQMQQNIYAWEEGNYKGVVMVQYQIINMSGDTLRDCAVGQVSDPDLGERLNDHIRFYHERPTLRAAYAWSERTGGDDYGALAMAIIEAPVTDSQGFIQNGRRHDYRANGVVGSFPNWIDENDPATQEARYDMMTSGGLTSDTGPGDKRALLASTKFNMYPGDTCHFTIAYAILEKVPEMGKVVSKDDRTTIVGASLLSDELDELLELLLEDYYVVGSFRSGSVSATADLLPGKSATVAAIPNPAVDHTTIDFTLPISSNVKIRIANALGETVLRKTSGTLGAGRHTERIDLGSLPAGVYTATVETSQGAQTIKLILAR